MNQLVKWNGRPGDKQRGIRIAVLNCTDSSRVGELQAWYDTYAAQCTMPGLFTTALRYENPHVSGTPDDPGFLSLYDILAPDLATAWPETEVHMKSLYRDYPDYISVVMAGTYGLVSSTDVSDRKEAPAGVFVLLSDAGEAVLREFTSKALESGPCTKASLYSFVEGFPDEPGQHMLVLETSATDPVTALKEVHELAASVRPEVRLAGSFRLVSSYP